VRQRTDACLGACDYWSAMADHVDDGTAYLAVDCSRSFAHELSPLYRALALECVAKRPVRMLVSAAQSAKGDPNDHLALRDALTLMVMTGLPPAFRLALVADAPDLRRRFLSLALDLKQLGISAAVCEGENEAWEWLGRKRPSCPEAYLSAL
jgi:hypothetical protein